MNCDQTLNRPLWYGQQILLYGIYIIMHQSAAAQSIKEVDTNSLGYSKTFKSAHSSCTNIVVFGCTPKTLNKLSSQWNL
jgi:hypothetical protein